MIHKYVTYFFTGLIFSAGPLFGIATAELGINQKVAVLAIPIDGSENPTTITRPGAYRLTKNLNNVPIIIDSDDVCLFLNGYSMDTTQTAITINAGKQDIVIQGGEITDQTETRNAAGILINDNCTNIVIQLIKIRDQGFGIHCLGGTGSTSIGIRNSMISDCTYGIYAANPIALRIKHVILSADTLYASGSSTAIVVDAANGVTIDHCTVAHITRGIMLSSSTESMIKSCVINFLKGRSTYDAGILTTGGSSTVIDNCTVNYVTCYNSTTTVDGITLMDEATSCIRNCLVNYITTETPSMPVGIAVRGTSTNCMVQNNIVSNIFSDSASYPGFGYYLDTATTPTNMFIGNKTIIRSSSAIITPYSANIPFVITAPFYPYTCPPNNDYCPSDFAWNWIIAS